ncbi:hypothetical protein ED733_005631 [Metarhizium rileyi]|uniref:Uncharacterized protein n=1 Tax=Metarhizium rileyi (strain RCEF 4871) TaxID=1649241 RepID=A0A5C6GFG3_METRR|nr:hypothetical protein ED733_005631 [Metarhizium rileyi]
MGFLGKALSKAGSVIQQAAAEYGNEQQRTDQLSQRQGQQDPYQYQQPQQWRGYQQHHQQQYPERRDPQNQQQFSSSICRVMRRPRRRRGFLLHQCLPRGSIPKTHLPQAHQHHQQHQEELVHPVQKHAEDARQHAQYTCPSPVSSAQPKCRPAGENSQHSQAGQVRNEKGRMVARDKRSFQAEYEADFGYCKSNYGETRDRERARYDEVTAGDGAMVRNDFADSK